MNIVREEKSFSVGEVELDYLKLMGSLDTFDARNPKDRKRVRDYLESIGLEPKKQGSDWILFQNEELGIRAFFSNYPMKDVKFAISPSMSIEFSGHFFIRENSWHSVKKLARWFSKAFGTFFKISRVDIRQDIYGARYPFDYFSFFGKGSNRIWATRSVPNISFFQNGGSQEITGFQVSTSRYQIKSYNRNLRLQAGKNSGKLTEDYLRYYQRIYKNRDVQRLEVVLKQDACKLFTILFFRGRHCKEEVLKLTLSAFGKNHCLKIRDPYRRIDNFDIDPVFEELFYLKKKDDVKLFKTEFHAAAGLKFSDVTFSPKGKSINEIIKMLGKKICEHAQGVKEVREDLMEKSLEYLSRVVDDLKDEFNKKYDNCLKTFSFMSFNLLEMLEANRPIDWYVEGTQ